MRKFDHGFKNRVQPREQVALEGPWIHYKPFHGLVLTLTRS